MSKHAPSKRCSDCGACVVKPAYERESWICARHPSAELIDWPGSMVRALEYLFRASKTTKDLDRWIEDHETGESDEFIGQGHLASALTYARRWNLPWVTAPIAGDTSKPTPDGLYGLPTH